MTVYLFGTVCSPACANFALKYTADAHNGEFNASTVQAAHNSFYVDDRLTSVSSVEEAKTLVAELGQLLSVGSFKINRWIGNDREAMNSIPKSEWSKNATNLTLLLNDLLVERALGQYWEVETDNLQS